jgi:hypothetical protein
MEFRDLFKDKKFNVVFSVILGLFVASLFKRPCIGGKCNNYMPPPVAEVEGSVYTIGDKCYRFKTRDMVCPGAGISGSALVEAYESA